MGWLAQTFAASIGKKAIMAVTGALLGLFAVIHAAGNATVFLGREAYLSYAAHLHALDLVIDILEPLLLGIFLLHVATGFLLTVQNFLARPRRYLISKNAGGRTFASQTMLFSGAAILLFMPVHLMNFHFKNGLLPIADLVRQVLLQPFFALLTIVAGLCLAVHVSHGFWSMFQTLGLDHPKYLPFIQGCALAFSIFLGVIFTLIPAAAFLQAGFLR